MQNLEELKNFKELYSSLNEEQKKAVELIDGPVLIVAGPGTGKTNLITARVANILSKTDSNPENILCLTFTDSASQEMRNRIRNLIGLTGNKVEINTYHAFCNNIIHSHPEYFDDLDLQALSEVETHTVVRKLIDNLKSDNILFRAKGDRYYDVERLIKIFSEMKKENMTAVQIANEIDKIPKQEKKYERTKAASLLFDDYVKGLKEIHRYDYDDMILNVIGVFQKYPELLLTYQEQYHYIMVDEFQDSNGSQFKLLQLLLNYWDRPNILCVGDDDQCIFEFQGARLNNIREFNRKYNPEIIMLNKNYRSVPAILNASGTLINYNLDRLINHLDGLSKNLSSEGKEVKELQILPNIQIYNSLFEEAADIVKKIEELWKNNSDSINQIAVIYRENIQSEFIAELLRKKEIPFTTRRTQNLLHHPIYKMVMEMLTHLTNEISQTSSGDLALFKIMHYPWFKIDSVDIARISISSSRSKTPIRINLNDQKKLNLLTLNNPEAVILFNNIMKGLFSNIYKYSPVKYIEFIINNSGLLKYIINEEMGDVNDGLKILTSLFEAVISESKICKITTLEELVAHFKKIEEMNISINVETSIGTSKGVTLSTCHSSKGLEFERVFIIGCTENKWKKKVGRNSFSLPPGLYSETQEDKNNESARRLFYVGMTRAKKYLQLSYSKNSIDTNAISKQEIPSKFISEIESSNSVNVSTTSSLTQEELNSYQKIYLQSKTSKFEVKYNSDLIDEYISTMVLSTSSLSSLINCGTAFYYEKILKAPSVTNESMILGSSVHLGLKIIGTKKEKTILKNIISVFEIDLKKNTIYLSTERYKRLHDHGNNILNDYYSQKINTWQNIIKTESIISKIDYNGINLSGMIDRIDETTDGKIVYDYKTSKIDSEKKKKLLPPSEENVDGGEYWRQLVFYKLLLSIKEKNNGPKNGIIAFLEREKGTVDFKEVMLTFTSDDIEQLWTIIIKYINQLKNHEIHSCNDCDWCEFAGKIKHTLFE